jgi:hypothetical protein
MLLLGNLSEVHYARKGDNYMGFISCKISIRLRVLQMIKIKSTRLDRFSSSVTRAIRVKINTVNVIISTIFKDLEDHKIPWFNTNQIVSFLFFLFRKKRRSQFDQHFESNSLKIKFKVFKHTFFKSTGNTTLLLRLWLFPTQFSIKLNDKSFITIAVSFLKQGTNNLYSLLLHARLSGSNSFKIESMLIKNSTSNYWDLGVRWGLVKVCCIRIVVVMGISS